MGILASILADRIKKKSRAPYHYKAPDRNIESTNFYLVVTTTLADFKPFEVAVS